jgi:hypothetical protein
VLYRGEFLPGFRLPGRAAFEEWLLLTRERYAHLALTALDTLTRAQLAVATGACLHILHAPGPYAGLNIASVTGISDAQKAALKALEAVEKKTLIRTTEERA